MADKNIFNDKDSMDINELASLNDDISPDLIDQLQEKLTNEAKNLGKDASQSNISNNFNENDDSTLFEETNTKQEDTKIQEQPKKIEVNLDKKFNDNFIKKYKAKLNKQQETKNKDSKKDVESQISNVAFSENVATEKNIEEISNGNIKERKLSKKQKNYNDSLDFLDNNIKYSKYVIYIDPENVPFIDSLTVKERKNLINRLLREQDDIAITKQRFRIINAVISHIIVALLTIAISIPVIYFTINTSLEATVNNYRRSQTIFQTLYKENGKINNLK